MTSNERLGFAGNYANKIFAPGYRKNLGKESMPAMLAALGCKIAIICDDEAELPLIIRRAIEERTRGAGMVSCVGTQGMSSTQQNYDMASMRKEQAQTYVL